MNAEIIPFPKGRALDNRPSLEARRSNPKFAALVDTIASRWPDLTREQCEGHALELLRRLEARMAEASSA